MGISLSEYDSFKRIADGLALARDGARMMAQHQPEHAREWLKMADVYTVSMQACYKLAEESVAKGVRT